MNVLPAGWISSRNRDQLGTIVYAKNNTSIYWFYLISVTETIVRDFIFLDLQILKSILSYFRCQLFSDVNFSRNTTNFCLIHKRHYFSGRKTQKIHNIFISWGKLKCHLSRRPYHSDTVPGLLTGVQYFPVTLHILKAKPFTKHLVHTALGIKLVSTQGTVSPVNLGGGRAWDSEL